jgi:hypothetical protein
MEPLRKNYGKLIAKLSHVSYLVKYYGYFHECAELFRQLTKASRKEWDDNLKPIIDVIMKNEECKLTLIINKPFNYKICNALLKSGMYNYFHLEVKFSSLLSYKAGILFLSKIEVFSPDMFKSLIADVSLDSEVKISEFFSLFDKKGLNKQGVYYYQDEFQSDLSTRRNKKIKK